MNFILILSFVLLSYLNCLAETKEFCQAFAENDCRISYVHRFGGKRFQIFIDVVINEYYWRLEAKNIDNFEDLKFVDPLRSGRVDVPFYKRQYSLALTTYVPNCFVLLINTNNWKALIGSCDDNPIPETIQVVNEVQLHGFAGKPFFGFQTGFDDWDPQYKNRIVFVDYNNKTGQLKASAFEMFKLDGSDNWKAKHMGLDGKMTFLTTNTNKSNLLALIHVYNNAFKTIEGFGYLLLFEENGYVKWCWNRDDSGISEQCKTGQILAHCSANIKLLNRIDITDRTTSLIITAIIILSIVIGGLLFLIIYWIMKIESKAAKENDSMATNNTEQINRTSVAVSKAIDDKQLTVSNLSKTTSKKNLPKNENQESKFAKENTSRAAVSTTVSKA